MWAVKFNKQNLVHFDTIRIFSYGTNILLTNKLTWSTCISICKAGVLGDSEKLVIYILLFPRSLIFIIFHNASTIHIYACIRHAVWEKIKISNPSHQKIKQYQIFNQGNLFSQYQLGSKIDSPIYLHPTIKGTNCLKQDMWDRPYLTFHYWQNWKRVFRLCYCHEIYRVEAVALKNHNYTWKITIFVNI